MSELKPCPFCFGAAEVDRMGSKRQSMIISCEDCGCSVETGETSIHDQITWNKRESDGYQSRIAELEEQLSINHGIIKNLGDKNLRLNGECDRLRDDIYNGQY